MTVNAWRGLWVYGSCTILIVAIGCEAPPSEPPSRADGGFDAGATPEPVVNDGRPDGVALCYSALSSEHPATTQFWDALRGGKLEDRTAAITALTAAVAEHPAEEELQLLLGLAHLWRVAEPLPEQAGDMAGLIAAALGSRTALEKARELCPTDYRIAAWLGPVLVNTGRATSDDKTIERGLDVLQQGIDHYPQFVLFSKLLVYAGRAKSDPDFQLALQAVKDNMAVCKPSDPACSNHAHALHNVEGASVFLGDVYAKAGDAARARDAYEMARGSSTYRDWDYQELLNARIAGMHARIAAYDDDDAENDPEAAWSATYQCSICHRQ